MKRPNLTIETGALTTRILFDKGRVSSVVYRRLGSERIVSAGVVIISGGAVNSPHLLLLSGVGPAAELEALGIDVVADLPGVGRNLHDHPIALLCRDCKQPVSLSRAESIGSLARFLLFKQGPLTSNIGEAGGFARIRAGAADAPDLQFHFAPSFFVNHGFDNPPGHGMSLGPTLVRPRSRGRLWLDSTDPTQPPAIDPCYFSEPEDLEILREGVELARDILSRPALAEFAGEERFPGAGVVDRAAVEHYLRQRAYTLYHPVGTCKMGNDSNAVVDAELRVHGIDGLRVVDASIMPTIVNGNTNAPTIMIAEKAAELFATDLAN